MWESVGDSRIVRMEIGPTRKKKLSGSAVTLRRYEYGIYSNRLIGRVHRLTVTEPMTSSSGFSTDLTSSATSSEEVLLTEEGIARACESETHWLQPLPSAHTCAVTLVQPTQTVLVI